MSDRMYRPNPSTKQLALYLRFFDDFYSNTFNLFKGKCAIKDKLRLKREIIGIMGMLVNLALEANESAVGSYNSCIQNAFETWLDNFFDSDIDRDNTIEIMEKRKDTIYFPILCGHFQPRGEWLFGNIKGELNPIYNCFIAFGDILKNPDCADDYKNSAIVIGDIFDTVELAKNMSTFIKSSTSFVIGLNNINMPRKNVGEKIREVISRIFKSTIVGGILIWLVTWGVIIAFAYILSLIF